MPTTDPAVAVLSLIGLGPYTAGIVALAGLCGYIVTWIAPLVPPPSSTAGWMARFGYAVIHKLAGNVGQAANAKQPPAA